MARLEEESNIIGGNIFSQIIGRLVVLVMSLLTIKLITNYIGTTGTGYYTTVVTYLTFFITIADFGIFSIGVREISKHPENKKKLLGNIFTVRLISALAVTILAVLIAQLTNYPEEIKRGVVICSAFLFFNLTGSIFDLMFQVRLQMKKVAIAESVSKLIALLALYLVIFLQLNFYWIIFTVSLSATVSVIIKYLLAASGDRPIFGYEKQSISEIVKLALPFGVIFIVNNFYFKVDTLILFYFKGAAEVGIYAVAYRVLETTVFGATYLAYSLKPLLSTSIENNKERAGAAASSGLLFLLFMSLIVGIACLSFPKEIILFLSDSAFIGGAPVLISLSFASIFIYFNTLISEILIAKDLRRSLLILAIVVLAFNVVTNIIFIPIYSYRAAGITTLASEILLFILGFIIARKIIPINVDFWRIGKLLFSAGVAILTAKALDSLGLYFIFCIVVALLLYSALAYLIDAIPKKIVQQYLMSLRAKTLS